MNRLIVFVMTILTLTAFTWIGYLEYQSRVLEKEISNLAAQPTLRRSQSSCGEFSGRFGVTTEELKDSINDEPDSAKVLEGFRYFFGEILSQEEDNLPLVVETDLAGKIVSIECEKFTLPQ